ncbi:hypothetical protein C8R45DRAFT_220063 [Mycena sanguinolenta]|nr:hypothetical protein C8R45DRAFT_220063 [Mycena sanguinolenta]
MFRPGSVRHGEQACSLPHELVDECLSHLDYLTDLTACALVSRSWSSPAQRLLFQVVHLSRTSQCESFESSLRSSPHLVAHVHTLGFRSDRSSELEAQAFANIYCFPFTHLAHICIGDGCSLCPEVVVALQPLLSLPTLRQVTLRCPTTFRALWENCAPSIRHLDWTLFPPPTSGPSVQRHSSPPIALESLRLMNLDYLVNFFDHDDAGCFFDFSRSPYYQPTASTA